MQNNSRTQNGQSINKRQIEDDIKEINNTSARERAQKTRVPISKKNLVRLCIVEFGKNKEKELIDKSHDQTGLVPPELLDGTIPAYNTPAKEKIENNTGIIDK